MGNDLLRSINGCNIAEPKFQLTLPNVLMIPTISIIFMMIKMCGGVDWDWATVLVIAPMIVYIIWSFGFLGSILLVFMIFKYYYEIKEKAERKNI